MFCLDAYYLKDDNDDYPMVTPIRDAPKKSQTTPLSLMMMAVTMILKALSLSLRGFRHLEVALAHFEPLHSKFCLVTRIHLPLLGGDDHEDVDEDGEDNGKLPLAMTVFVIIIDLDMYCVCRT